MRIVKIQFDDSEPPFSVARRIVFAFNPGNCFKVGESFFKVTRLNTVVPVAAEAIQGEYTQVVPSDPNAVAVKEDRLKLIGESVERRKSRTSEIPPPPPSRNRERLNVRVPANGDTLRMLKPGQTWRPRDSRRKSTFTIAKVEDGFIHASDGRKVAIERLHRYEMVG
jgi:hypothetical protein